LPKKTLETIVDSENHYIIQVKANQKKLQKQVQSNASKEKVCIDYFLEEDEKRGRVEIRETFIYKDINGISDDWKGIKRLIRVERCVLMKEKESHETAYFISDIRSNKASLFAKHIRSHWGIENRLH
jgi:predicted transposase YbfD/YdcC